MGNAPTSQAKAGPTDDDIKRAIMGMGVERLQQIYSQSLLPSAQNGPITINPQNVGLLRGFIVKISGTVTNTNVGASGTALTRTGFGVSNALTNIGFTDTNNQVRHQTQGWHMGLINSARQPMVFGGAYAPNVPVAYGNNFDVMTAPASIAAGADGAIQTYYYVPVMAGKWDFRGAMWAGVTNAVAQLQLTINPNPIAATGDAGLAMYSGNTGSWKAATNVTITVWQDYIDQIPLMPDGNPYLPLADVQLLYQLNNTNMSGFVPGQDFGFPYANFRSFWSTVVVYDNAGVYNPGTDINSFKLQTANASNIWQYGPEEAALFARSTFMADPPPAVYYFDSRSRPINTQQFGNMQITMNPSAVTAGANALLGYEYIASASQVQNAASLPSGG